MSFEYAVSSEPRRWLRTKISDIGGVRFMSAVRDDCHLFETHIIREYVKPEFINRVLRGHLDSMLNYYDKISVLKSKAPSDVMKGEPGWIEEPNNAI
jgi:hypothetical protein